MLMIRTLRRAPCVLPLTRWLTDTATTVFILVSLAIMFACVDNSIHLAVLAIG
jgi:hypothetical protein